MIRNLSILFLLVISMILGLAWYHYASTKSMKVLPIQLYHWSDASGQTSAYDITKKGDFRADDRRRHNFGYTTSIHWFRFQASSQDIPQSLSLEIKNHTINCLELFEFRNGKITSLGKTGDQFLFAQRPSPTKTFVYPIYLNSYQSSTFYLRLDKRFESLVTEINLWNTSDFEDQEQRIYLLWGIFLGVVALVVLLNFFFWISTRDQVYLWYGFYVIGLLMRQLADSGLSFQYLWANAPQFNYPDPLIQALWFYLPSILHFQQRFLDFRTHHKKLFIASQVLKYGFWVGLLMLTLPQIISISPIYTLSQQSISGIHSVLSILTTIVFLWVATVGIRSNETLKKIYAYGFLIQIILQLFVLIQSIVRNRNDGVYFIDSYLFLLVVFLIDLVVFSYLLAYQYRKSTDDSNTLQVSLAKMQQDTNQKIIEVLESEREQVQQLLQIHVGKRLSEALKLLRNAHQSPLLSDSELLIEKVNDDLDKISQNVLPLELIEKGFSESLKQILKKLNQTQEIIFVFEQKGTFTKLSVTQEVQLFRIVNELINNILKHSKATKSQLQLVYEGKYFSLLVKDNGQGFDTAQRYNDKQGIGLKNLYARTQELNGKVAIDSGDKGTTIRVVVPL